MNIEKNAVILITGLIIAKSAALSAQQSSIMFTPPPVPWYEFAEGQKDGKLNACFFYATGTTNTDDPEFAGDVRMYGGLGSGVFRYAVNNFIAVDAGAAAGGMYGTFGDFATASMFLASIPVNLELQPVRTDRMAMILFGGYSMSWNNMYVAVDTYSATGTITMYTQMHGPQFGGQLTFKLGGFAVNPFYMMTRQSGTLNLYVRSDEGDYDYVFDIPSTTVHYVGIDIIHKSSGISLSSIIQTAQASGNNKGYNVYTFSMGFSPRGDDSSVE